MAGEIVKTQGIVLAVYPWSQTSHVVTWLTPDQGPVTTLVKGAVRAKSAFLGQYDLFYRCDLLYYARASGDLHALREVTPRNLRERLRGDWRATALAGYAADLVKDLAPANTEATAWFSFLDSLLTRLEKHYPGHFTPEFMVTGDDVRYGKPNPEPYLMALKKAGVVADEALVVENAPLGVRAAVAAGIRTIAVNTGPLDPQLLLNEGASWLFPSMQALADHFDELPL